MYMLIIYRCKYTRAMPMFRILSLELLGTNNKLVGGCDISVKHAIIFIKSGCIHNILRLISSNYIIYSQLGEFCNFRNLCIFWVFIAYLIIFKNLIFAIDLLWRNGLHR